MKLSEAEDQKANTFGTELKDENGNVNGLSLSYEGGANSCETDPS